MSAGGLTASVADDPASQLAIGYSAVYMALLYCGVARGLVATLRKDARWVPQVFLGAVAVYLLIMAAGPESYARFRVPVVPILGLPLHHGDPDAPGRRALASGGSPRALVCRGHGLRRPEWRRHAGPGLVPGGVCLGQGRGAVSGGYGQAAAGRQEGAGQLSPALGWRGRPGRHRARHGVRAPGHGTRAHPLVEAARVGQHRSGYSGRSGRPPGRLRAAEQRCEAHRVPAAHAHPRHVSVPGADLPDHAGHERDRELREFRLQLALGLQLRG